MKNISKILSFFGKEPDYENLNLILYTDDIYAVLNLQRILQQRVADNGGSLSANFKEN